MLGVNYGQYHPRLINGYVPAMMGCAAVRHGAYIADFGTPCIANATGLLNAVADASTYTLANMTTVTGFNATTGELNDVPWGRCLQVVASGACTSVVTIKGYDYLGQPMSEDITANGNTPVIGVKAFKWILSIAITEGGSSTLNVGWTDKLGLPYATQGVEAEWGNGLNQSTGTLVASVMTDPQTATTVDPRGTYDPTVALSSGATRIIARFRATNFVNASGNGGLMGIRHFTV